MDSLKPTSRGYLTRVSVTLNGDSNVL